MARQDNHKNLFRDSLPERIYFDTNFVVNLLFGYERNIYQNLACRYFVQKLLKNNSQIYFSSILFPEFWHSILKIKTAQNFGLRSEKSVFVYLKDPRNKKQAMKLVYPEIAARQRQFDELMRKFNENRKRVFVIETEKVIMIEAEKHIQQYQLLSYDAIHLASATIDLRRKEEFKKPPVHNIATVDSDFLRIKDAKFSFWCNGAAEQQILQHEKTLKSDELFEDGILLKRTRTNSEQNK